MNTYWWIVRGPLWTVVLVVLSWPFWPATTSEKKHETQIAETTSFESFSNNEVIPTVLLSPELSSARQLTVAVLTKSDGFQSRLQLRKYHRGSAPPNLVQFVFPVGRLPNNTHHDAALEQEHSIFKDLLVLNYEDCWKQLNKKMIGTLNWFASRFSSNDSLILKTDDDVVINWTIFSRYLVEELLPRGWVDKDNKTRQLQSSPLFMGQRLDSIVVDRNNSSRYYEPNFPNATFPIYCDGPFILLNRISADEFAKARRSFTMFMRNDDALLGVLAQNITSMEVADVRSKKATAKQFGHGSIQELKKHECSDWWWLPVDDNARNAAEAIASSCTSAYLTEHNHGG
eukprot:Gregarina_sp_Poly_1__11232@NODE_925_length_5688_cov_92_671233_g658_i0_p3_GENE_NODE_925_length_5688_cov_92_671233_g658_i0NODE_925_length_5688_cov_92_671233_g658_i0_p3_ORF_typecomplete_len343_score39_83Galactosyl_T/PF01762_21/2_5e27DUF1428/PF07237_11/3_2e03DUF1428/PF07237_11/0_56_NODE_925_length_5688_cov_92_671233_g658_i026613689